MEESLFDAENHRRNVTYLLEKRAWLLGTFESVLSNLPSFSGELGLDLSKPEDRFK